MALLAGVLRACVEEVSTRRVDGLFKVGCNGISKPVLSLPKRARCRVSVESSTV